MKAFSLVILLVTVFGAVLATAEIDTRGGRIDLELVSEVESIRPGEPFSVGLHIRHDPAWHTYWRHPGIVGVPTSLKWDLPEGFEGSEIHWPPPERVKMTVLTAYGYEREVLLIVDIMPPGDFEAGQVTLKAKAAWMACAKTCHPGWGDLELTLPVKKSEEPDWDPKWRPRFEAERASWPEPLRNWETKVRREGDDVIQLTLTPENDDAVPEGAEVYFYSYDPQVDSDAPQKVKREKDGSLTLILSRPEFAPENPDNFSGLVYNSAGWLSSGGGKFAEIAVDWAD